MDLHEFLLFGLEALLEVTFKRGLRGCSQEETIGYCEVKGGDEETYRLHDIPVKFPEGEPHEPKCLDH